MVSEREYISHYYEYECETCKQKIERNTLYHLHKREIPFHGQRVTEFYRTHVKCPEVNNAISR